MWSPALTPKASWFLLGMNRSLKCTVKRCHKTLALSGKGVTFRKDAPPRALGQKAVLAGRDEEQACLSQPFSHQSREQDFSTDFIPSGSPGVPSLPSFLFFFFFGKYATIQKFMATSRDLRRKDFHTGCFVDLFNSVSEQHFPASPAPPNLPPAPVLGSSIRWD